MLNDPVLVLQMQRLGDLVLSFPLLSWLKKAFPHPVVVAAEPFCIESLSEISPELEYLPYSDLDGIIGRRYRSVLNLSHRQEAAEIASAVHSTELFGSYSDAEGRLRVKGDWRLYRTGLPYNNFYNLYHWSDLNALDIVPHLFLKNSSWRDPPFIFTGEKLSLACSLQFQTARDVRIGLFLGASENEKRPDSSFWTELAQLLLQEGYHVYLLGGVAEQSMGHAVAEAIGRPELDLTGKFHIPELSDFLRSLNLLLTPDTGPMHIAAYLGVPTINLSMGPVNAWETAPSQPGHLVIRANLPCAGCWTCSRDRQYCKELFQAAKIAAIVKTIFAGSDCSLSSLGSQTAGLEISITARGRDGLFNLVCLLRDGSTPDNANCTTRQDVALQYQQNDTLKASIIAREEISLLWKAWYGYLFGLFPKADVLTAQNNLFEQRPKAGTLFASALVRLRVQLIKDLRQELSPIMSRPDYWQSAPLMLQPLSGFTQMYLMNNLGSKKAKFYILEMLEELSQIIPGSKV